MAGEGEFKSLRSRLFKASVEIEPRDKKTLFKQCVKMVSQAYVVDAVLSKITLVNSRLRYACGFTLGVLGGKKYRWPVALNRRSIS